MDKKTEKKFDNLLQSILFRLSSIEDSTKNINNNYKSKKKKWYYLIMMSSLKWLFTFLLTIFIVIPTTYQINDTLSAKKASLNYEVVNLEPHSTTFGESSYSRDNSDNKYSFNFNISGNFNSYYGIAKNIFLAYTTNEQSEFSEKNLHPVNFKSNNMSFNYITRSIPYINNSNVPLQTFSFHDNISFILDSSSTTKPVYLIVIDKFNNVDISLILITGDSGITNTSNSPHSVISKINLETLLKKPSLQFYSAQDILKIQNERSSEQLPLAITTFDEISHSLSSIIRKYYSVNE